MRISLWAALLALGLAALPARAEKISVIYARELAEDDSRMEYPVRLLELALKKAGVDFVMRANDRPMPQSAAIKRLAAGIDVNVVWSMTTQEREDQLLPIRIPIDKGLFGYRIAFVRQRDAQTLSHVKSLQDLRLHSAGQGHDWPDTDILRANGLKVVTTSAHQSLFPMMELGRFDYFPRSVLEVWEEVGTPAAKDVAIDEHILIHYPAAVYFFVNKSDTPLAHTLEKGLNRAVADGSFDALYYELFGAAIKRAKFGSRQLIRLNNPLLPKETPLSRKSLWLNPKSQAK